MSEVISRAGLSECGQYRYWLTRSWVGETMNRPATFIMLNPSTADAEVDDPTIRRCVGYAKAWGCDGLVVVNLFAYRATDPRVLRTVADPVGPENAMHLRHAVQAATDDRTPLVAAWGANAPTKRVREFLGSLNQLDRWQLTALALTRDHQPRHPLYLKADLTPKPWGMFEKVA